MRHTCLCSGQGQEWLGSCHRGHTIGVELDSTPLPCWTTKHQWNGVILAQPRFLPGQRVPIGSGRFPFGLDHFTKLASPLLLD